MALLVHSKKIKKTDSNQTPSFWNEGFLRLFISHLSTDKIIAQNLKDKLLDFGISGFVAHSDIEPTKEWMQEIELALKTCDAVLALITPKFHESNWTDQEIGLAMGFDKLLIPVMMGRNPYGFIGKFQAISSKDSDIPADKIFNALIKNIKTQKAMSYALMQVFENSNSYAAAKINIDLVKKMEYWDDKLIKRLEKSVKENSQIRHSFGVSSTIDNLVNKLKNKYST